MTSMFLDVNSILSLSNKDLIKKQADLEIKISKAHFNPVSKDIANDMEIVYNIITEEIDKRLEDGRMDEDELDDD